MAGEEHINSINNTHHHHINGTGTEVALAVNVNEPRGSGRAARVIVSTPKNSLTREDRKPRVPRQCRTCGGAYRQSCHIHAIRSFINAFCLSYGIRATVAIIFRGIQLFRKSPRSFFNIKELASGNLSVQEECFRLGMFTGSFVGGFNYVHCLLQRFWGKHSRNSLIAGGIAGLSVRFLAKDSQRTLSLYIVARLLQCLYNEAKRVGYFKPIPHGDALLFAISSAQVMYSYVMRPDSLPKSYLSFIQRTGPIDVSVLDTVRAHHRGAPLPLAAVTSYVSRVTPASLLPSILPAIVAKPNRIGCNLLHPHTPACSTHVCFVFINAFKRTFPLYASLTFAPIFVLRLMPLLRAPGTLLRRGVFDTIRSTTFLATFVSAYQAAVCAQRNVFSGDHRVLYWFAGLIASAAIFIEKQTRRSELALYVMPRAADAFYMQLRDHRVLTAIPGGEALLFMLGSAGLMYFHHDHNGRSMSPMMNSLFNLFFGYRRII